MNVVTMVKIDEVAKVEMSSAMAAGHHQLGENEQDRLDQLRDRAPGG